MGCQRFSVSLIGDLNFCYFPSFDEPDLLQTSAAISPRYPTTATEIPVQVKKKNFFLKKCWSFTLDVLGRHVV